MDERENHSRAEDHLVEPLFGGLGHRHEERDEEEPVGESAGEGFWVRWWRRIAGGQRDGA